MKIVLDPQIFNIQKYGGISRYYTEIFSILAQKSENDVVLPLFYTNNVYLKESKLLQKNNNLFFSILFFLPKIGISTKSITRKKSKQLANNTISNADYDLFVPTYYDSYFIDFLGSKPFVLTVYDMIHELFPQYFADDSFGVVKNKILLMEKATTIIAVSQNTKRDILKIYPHIDASKIEVVYHGSSIKIDESVKVNLPDNYILFVGSRDNYKNFIFLLKSIATLLKKNSSLSLICAGGGEFKKRELDLITELELENQIIQISFQENELGHYYKNAKCFVFPSMYEGFGIPVLESMACGCPIVLANHSSFPEVAGDAGVYFDLNSSEDLKIKIEDLITDENLRKEYSEKGLEQVKKFNWKNAAEECLKVYEMACEKIKN
jgi:glycosyltransferase involved in cell wall biosynthesis